MATQRAVLVLGAGRSGTSTLTRGLQALGVFIGSSFRRPVRKNPRGNFEEVNLLRQSKAARRAVGLRAESVRLLPASAWHSPKLNPVRERTLRLIEREFSGHGIWAFKYGGMGRILPFWLDVLSDLDIEPSFAFAYRNPLSVARSRGKLDRFRGRVTKNNLEWLANVVPYFDLIRGYPVAVVDYDRLLADPRTQLVRLADHLEIPQTAEVLEDVNAFAAEFVRPDWRHTRFCDADLETAAEIQPLVRRMALLLSHVARDERSLSDPDIWEEIADIQSEHHAMAPLLELVDTLQVDVRRARWWDLTRPLQIAWNKLPLLRLH